MEYKTMLRLQKCLYFNFYLYITWVVVVGFFLYSKMYECGKKTFNTVLLLNLFDVEEAKEVCKGLVRWQSVGSACSWWDKGLNSLGHLTKYLSLTVFTLLIVIESARIYLGHYGNLCRRVPELAGFLMLTILMEMPLVSFFLFNPYLMSTPMEITLHIMLFLLTLTEVVFSFMALKQASDLAKSIYLSQPKDR